MVQYAVLRWASEYPDLLTYTDNIRLLDGLTRHRLLDERAGETLADAYRSLRAAYHRNVLQGQPGLVAEDKLLQERETVRDAWTSLMDEPVV